jgi:hypothetical protein
VPQGREHDMTHTPPRKGAQCAAEFAEGFAMFRKMLAEAGDQAHKLAILEHCAYETARCFVPKGLAKADGVDELHAIAIECGLVRALGEQAIQNTLATAYAEGEAEQAPPDESDNRAEAGRQTHDARRKANGGAKHQHDVTQTATDMQALKSMRFAPLKYVVPGIIVEGLTLFAGKPKIGKSWLVLHAGVAVASGGFTLGDIHCIQGDVIYYALEDNLRRLQSRATKLLGITQDWPKHMRVCCKLPRLSQGGLAAIEQWIAQAEHPRLILIDTLAMVKPPAKGKDQTQYDADYAAVLELRTLAHKYNIAIVAIHHLRKADADDAFDTVSATLGLTGAVDSVLVLKRDTAGNIILHGRGRDLIDIEKAMSFDPDSCLWRITGDAAAVTRSKGRQQILDAIAQASEPIGPRDIADITSMRSQNVRQLLHKLLAEGAIEKAGHGKYRPRAKAAKENV